MLGKVLCAVKRVSKLLMSWLSAGSPVSEYYTYVNAVSAGTYAGYPLQ